MLYANTQFPTQFSGSATVDRAKLALRFFEQPPQWLQYVGVPKVKGLNAHWLLNAVKGDMRWLGLNQEDWMNRIMLIGGLYAPQTYFAIRDKRHVVETMSRNTLMWFLAIGFSVLTKHPTIGINSLLNYGMLPKLAKEALPQYSSAKTLSDKFQVFMRRLTNPLALEGDYKQLFSLVEHFPKNTHWSSLDNVQSEAIFDALESLSIGKPLAALTHEEKNLIRLGEGFFKRLNRNRLIGLVAISLLNMYLIGQLAMEVVFRVFAPLDADFNPKAYSGKTLFSQAPKNDALTPKDVTLTMASINPVLSTQLKTFARTV